MKNFLVIKKSIILKNVIAEFMKPRYIPFLLLIVSLFSCDKDEIRKKEPITIGEYNNMIVSFYDTILIGGYYNKQVFTIDVDENSEPDFSFVSEIWGSPGMGQHPRSEIQCLHDKVKLCGYYTTDTLYLNRDSLIDNQPDNVVVYRYFKYTCQQIDKADSVVTITPDVFNILPKERGDTLSFNEDYKTDTVELGNDYWGNNNSIYPKGTDTLVYEVVYHYNDCNIFPAEKIVYIGFKIEDEFERLGWLKISVVDLFKISILESAVSK